MLGEAVIRLPLSLSWPKGAVDKEKQEVEDFISTLSLFAPISNLLAAILLSPVESSILFNLVLVAGRILADVDELLMELKGTGPLLRGGLLLDVNRPVEERFAK